MTTLIAAAAIGLAAWEGLETRRYDRLSVRPRLQAGADVGGDSADHYVRFSVENTGLGPAVIRRFTIYLDGAPAGASSPEGASDSSAGSGPAPEASSIFGGWQPVID
ncbi:MAG TPA: hypothetical protein VKA44_08435, partial [Gemmatimonadota bacterium]|nr:hypothetical protein [Gemmatimonadota bacterium]